MSRRKCLSWLCVLPLWLVGCGDGGETPADTDAVSPSAEAASLRIMAGDLQVGHPGESLQPIRMQVLNAEGNPVPGATVAFAVRDLPDRSAYGIRAGEVSLSADEVTSDDEGLVSVVPTLGQTPGGIVMEARALQGKARPLVLHLWSYPSTEGNKRPLCLLSINDFHMHLEPWGGPPWHRRGGLARLAALLKALRAANDAAGIPTVIFNAGDDFENTLFQDEPGAFEALMKTWDRVGVDFWQVGNHDFHFGIPFLTDRILSVQADFAAHNKGHPMIITWGNVDPATLFEHVASYRQYFETQFSDPDDTLLYQQTAVLETGGVRVGVMGAVTDAAIYTQVPGDPLFFKIMGASAPDAQGLQFLDPDPRQSHYVGSAIDDLDGRDVDIIVVNSHAGLGLGDRVNIPPGKDEHIARHGLGPQSGRPVDVIISGHSHVQLNHSIFLETPAGNHTGIIQALEGGIFVARCDLMVDTAANTVQWVDSRLIQVDETTGEDGETAAVVRSLTDKLDERYPERLRPVAHSETYLTSRERTVCGLGQLINAGFLHALADIGGEGEPFTSFVVPSTYRTDIHPGPLDQELVYQILSMHKMDDKGTNNDTVAYIAARPGRFDISLMGIEQTLRTNIMTVEYFIEMAHSFEDILSQILPTAADELRLEVIQFGGVSYVLDATAPPFSRVVEGSLQIHGSPPEPDRVYRVAAAHSIIATLGRVLHTFAKAKDPITGQDLESVVYVDEVTGEPFYDTSTELWESLYHYLTAEVGEGHPIDQRLVTVTGEHFRTVQPDLTVNPADITIEPSEATPGEEIAVTVAVRNLGETPVTAATVALYIELTPWDQTDDPDGFAALAGLPGDHLGSCQKIAEASTAVQAYPGRAEVSFRWTVPPDLPAWTYPIEVRITAVSCETIDPNTGQQYVEYSQHNNSGRQQSRLLYVR